MLLVDGVKYELWTPSNEAEFEQVVKEHAQDIFGKQSIYLDLKQKLKSVSGIGSIPDGYALILADKPSWYIVEVELSRHDVHAHIVPQVIKFVAAIKNPSNRKAIVDAIYERVSEEQELKQRVKSKVSTEIYKFLTSLIDQQPRLAIVINQKTEQLSEALEGLKLEPQVIELRTLVSRRDLSRRAYLFEPVTAIDPTHFLAELRQEVIRRRPELKIRKPAKHHCQIATGHKGIHLAWLFFHALERKLGVELHLERTTFVKNSQLLAKVKAKRSELENTIGESLGFESPWRKKWSRVYALKEINWTPQFRGWAVETMIKFFDAFKPLLDEIDR